MAGESLSIDGSNLESAKVSARLTFPTMKKILLAFVLVALCGVTSCIPTSINPLYTGQDLVFDPALIGVWRGEGDSKETWAFEKAGDKEYKFVYTEEDGTHSFLKVARIEPALQMAPLDLKWVREFLEKNPKAIRHHKIGEGDEAQIVLTDSTPELRKFVQMHLKTDGAFGESINLKRRQSETKPQK